MQQQQQRSRPTGVSILAVLAGVGFVVNTFVTLLFLGIIPATLFGGVGFFGQALLGAMLWGFMAAIWAWVAVGLWNLKPQAWLFVVLLSVITLIFDVVALLGSSTFAAMWPSMLLNVIILAYALSSGVKAAFAVPEQGQGPTARAA